MHYKQAKTALYHRYSVLVLARDKFQTVQDHDFNSNIATKTFTGNNNRIEFQSGDVIGYWHRSNACYRV